MVQNIQPETPENKGKEAYLEAGADYVISSIEEIKELIYMINARLVFRERPER
jgi:phosphoglycolate phosphatase-like HAD superfamily hydrolase